MKKLFFIPALLFLFSSSLMMANNGVNPKHDSELSTILKRVKNIKGSITLSGGCVVDYDITVDYDIIPPRVNSIHGTVTMSGNCSGTQTFRASAATDPKGKIVYVQTDLKDPVLQTGEFDDKFIDDLNNANIFN
ncbi:hypothetical protein NHF50_07810 [Flavobacterium sp. NRK F10]|uniref:hypothetical protein n=1 Tax=Flavobacterium sp. NRK F10 TaxID=2954931 RepID=UPI002090605C|nr:hypothetical protein [Flavobacterium sp. NRK F10]MCO6174951.1 hypothetical protein [Flavobacterium sp. NRK F10]